MDAVLVLGADVRHFIGIPRSDRHYYGTWRKSAEIQFEDRRFGVLDPRDVMLSVAIGASRGGGGADGPADSMNAAGVLFGGVFVQGAIHDTERTGPAGVAVERLP